MDIYNDVIILIFGGMLKAFIPLLPYITLFAVLFVCISAASFFIFNFFYKQGTYYKITGNPYLSTRLDLGKYGEYLTYKELRCFEKQGGRFLFNIYIPTTEGGTSEIDVMLICKQGIFVFESKNYSGWIFGSENQPKWTQTLPRVKGKSKKVQFYNPIMQNKSHIKHLKKLIGEDIPIHSVIVFSYRCTLKNVTVKSSNIPVIKRSDVSETVVSICRNSSVLLTKTQIDTLYNTLHPFTQVDEKTKSEHIARIKGDKVNTVPNMAKTEDAVDPTIADENPEKPTDEPLTCPRCGSDLVLRTAKRGDKSGQQFYGCSAYPKCRYMKNI